MKQIIVLGAWVVLAACGGPDQDPVVGTWIDEVFTLHNRLIIQEDLTGTAWFVKSYDDQGLVEVEHSLAMFPDSQGYRMRTTILVPDGYRPISDTPCWFEDPTRFVCGYYHADQVTIGESNGRPNGSSVYHPEGWTPEAPASSGSGDGAQCHGSASSCSGGGRTSCESQRGCSWTPDYRHGNYIGGDCDGSPDRCDSLDESDCRHQSGCSWR